MRFSPISAPQRKETSFVTPILPSQITSPPGRTASAVVRKATGLTADSSTTSAPRLLVRPRAAPTTSPLQGFTVWVAPMPRARASLASSRSAAKDGLRPREPRPLYGGESDRAATDDESGVDRADMRHVQCCTRPGHDTAADQARLAATINFLNPETQLQELEVGRKLVWRSATTGNMARIDLWLEDGQAETILLEANFGGGRFTAAEIGREDWRGGRTRSQRREPR
jgi:hypothetical protein